MSINFTGFNNIKIGKKQYEQFGSYCNHNGEILRGKKKYTELKFNTQLTNDQKGNDLDDFLKRAPKKFINEQNPDKLDLRIKRFDIEDSDIDIVALVHGSREVLQAKLKKVWDVSAELGMENDIIVSPMVVPYDEFVKYKQTLPYYRNIAEEGKKIG